MAKSVPQRSSNTLEAHKRQKELRLGSRERGEYGMVQNRPFLGNTFQGPRRRQFWQISFGHKSFWRKVATARVLPWFEPCREYRPPGIPAGVSRPARRPRGRGGRQMFFPEGNNLVKASRLAMPARERSYRGFVRELFARPSSLRSQLWLSCCSSMTTQP